MIVTEGATGHNTRGTGRDQVGTGAAASLALANEFAIVLMMSIRVPILTLMPHSWQLAGLWYLETKLEKRRESDPGLFWHDRCEAPSPC